MLGLALTALLLAPPPAEITRIDLRTPEGVAQVQAEWRFTNVKIVEVEGKAPDGSPNRTYNIDPPSTAVTKPDFDPSSWELVDPTTLGRRRSTGLVCFAWYLPRKN
jgi:hypothetical protein